MQNNKNPLKIGCTERIFRTKEKVAKTYCFSHFPGADEGT